MFPLSPRDETSQGPPPLVWSEVNAHRVWKTLIEEGATRRTGPPEDRPSSVVRLSLHDGRPPSDLSISRGGSHKHTCSFAEESVSTGVLRPTCPVSRSSPHLRQDPPHCNGARKSKTWPARDEDEHKSMPLASFSPGPTRFDIARLARYNKEFPRSKKAEQVRDRER